MGDVVSLQGGGPIEAGAQPQHEVIDTLEGLLAEAKAGNISAIGIVYCQPDEMVSRAIVGRMESLATLRMIGGIELLKGQITRLFDDPPDD